jgi:flagellum-specific peptidoglycan hydrolase FlgJ
MPTIIDELTMTLKLDPTEFGDGIEQAKATTNSFLQQVLATLQRIEQETEKTATNTAHTQQRSAEQAIDSAEKTAAAQEAAAKKAAHEQQEAAKQTAEVQREAARRAEEAYGKTADSVKRVATELLALFGISMSVSAIERLFSGILRTNEQASNLARSIGMDVDALTTWENMAGRLGGTAQGTASALATLARERQAWHYTGKSNMPSQAREIFGANIIGPDGEMMSPDDIALVLADAADRKGMTGAQRQYGVEQMGVPGLAPAVISGGAEIRKEREYQQRSGNITTPQDAKDALALSAALDKVENSAMGLARAFWRELGPGITQIVERIERWIDKNRDWLTEKATEWGKRLGEAILALARDFDLLINGGAGQFATTIGEIAHVANEAVQAIGGWHMVMEAFATFWLGSKIFAAIKTIISLKDALLALVAARTAAGAVGAAGAVAGTAASVAAGAGTVGVIAGIAVGSDILAERHANQAADALGYDVKDVTGEFEAGGGNAASYRHRQTGEVISREEMEKRVAAAQAAAGKKADEEAAKAAEAAHSATPAQPAGHPVAPAAPASDWWAPSNRGGPAPAPLAPAPPPPAATPTAPAPTPTTPAAPAFTTPTAPAPTPPAAAPTAPAPTSSATPAPTPTPAAAATEAPRPGGSASLTPIGTPVEGPVAPAGGGFASAALTQQFAARHGDDDTSSRRPSWMPNWVPEFIGGPRAAPAGGSAAAAQPTPAGGAAAMPASTAVWGRGTGIGEGAPRALPPIGTPAADAPGWPGGPGGGGGGGQGEGGGGGGGGEGAGAPAAADGPVAPLGVGGGKSAFYDEQRKLIYDAAVKAGLPHPEVVAEVGATQATLESGGGAHTPGGYNVYGIKSGGGVGGAGAPVSTQEEGKGGRYTINASFATFGSKEEAATGYVEFLKRHPKHYAPVLAAKTVAEGLEAQGHSGYATASNYQSTLESIHKRYGTSPAPQVASAATPPTPQTLPPRAPLAPSPAAVSTLTPPVPVAAQASAGGGSWAGGSQTLPPVGASTTAQEFQMASNTSNVDRSQSSQTHIGDLHVHTAATDAAGIAKSIKGELKRYDYVSQVDTGLV